MTSFRRKQGTYRVQDEPTRPSNAKQKNTILCNVDLLDDNTMKVELEVSITGGGVKVPGSVGVWRCGGGCWEVVGVWRCFWDITLPGVCPEICNYAWCR